MLTATTGETTTYYVFGIGLLYQEEDGETLFYHFNNIGSTEAVTDIDGKIVEKFAYGPYGELLSANECGIMYLYNGEYVVVEFVQHEILEEPVKVYNFEVEGFHTYFVGESSVLVHNMCAPAGFTNESNIGTQPKSSEIRFSQNSISSRFKNGSSVDDMITGLRSGTIDPNDVPAIRIFEKDGVLYTLDNRRLYAFQQAGIENIPYQWATSKEIANEAWKFTTTNGGVSIEVRRR